MTLRAAAACWMLLSGAAARAATPAPNPAAPWTAISGTCTPQEATFTDLDMDGTDDLLMRYAGSLYGWPSTTPGAPAVWAFGPGLSDTISFASAYVDVGRPAQVLVGIDDVEGMTAYQIDPQTLGLDLQWLDSVQNYPYHIGDVDGDGLSDISIGTGMQRFSTAGLAETPELATSDIPYWGMWPIEVGDLNGDGYDDAAIPSRVIDPVDDPATFTTTWSGNRVHQYGPLVLALGSPDGYAPTALWVIEATDYPLAGLGRRTAVMPDRQTVVATLVEEGGLFRPDWGPGYLGVIRNAHTADASLDQVVFATEFEPGTEMDPLVASLENGDGTASVLLVDVSGSAEGMTVFTWDPNAVEPLSAAPTATWFPDGLNLDQYFSFLAVPAGLRYQGFVLRHFTEWEPGSELLVWGRAPEDVGFGPTLTSTIDGCTFTARVYDGLPPPEVTEPPPVIEDGADCGSGCATSGPSRVGGVLVWLVWASANRRARQEHR